MKILNSKPRQDNSVILFQKGFCQQTDKNQSFIELVLGAAFLQYWEVITQFLLNICLLHCKYLSVENYTG